MAYQIIDGFFGAFFSPFTFFVIKWYLSFNGNQIDISVDRSLPQDIRLFQSLNHQEV